MKKIINVLLIGLALVVMSSVSSLAQPSKQFAIDGDRFNQKGLAKPYKQITSEGKRSYVSSHLIVKLRNPGLASELAESFDAKIEKELKGMNIVVFQVPEEYTAKEFKKILEKNSNVEYVELDWIRNLKPIIPKKQDIEETEINNIPNSTNKSSMNPGDPFFGLLWGLQNTGQLVKDIYGQIGADISATDAWEMTRGGSNVIIAVIDGGVKWDHEDLAANMWVNPGEIADNGIDDDGNGYIDDIHGWDFLGNDNDTRETDNHATHVAGTIGAVGNNGIGISGVCWEAKIMSVRIIGGSVPSLTLSEAIKYAVDNGAKIINASYGITEPGEQYFDQIEYDAIKYARDRDVLFVISAMNSSLNIDQNPIYPASYDLDNIISVAATDQNDQLADFSNYGVTSVDVAAPGVNIYSCSNSSQNRGEPDVLFFDDFESYTENWKSTALEETNYTFWGPVTRSKYGVSTTCMNDYPNDYYVSGADVSLWTVIPIDVANYKNLTLTFQADLRIHPNDFLFVGVANENSIYWEAVGRYNGFTEGFRQVEISLAAYDGSSQLFIIFQLRSDVSLNEEGAYIDDVMITGQKIPTGGESNSGYMYMRGTSMAAPHVSGLAGLILSVKPDMTYLELKETILGSVDVLPNLNSTVGTSGRINCKKALAMATSVVEDVSDVLPSDFALSQNYPNPFNPETVIEFSLPRASATTVEIFNLLGQKVRDLVNDELTAGRKAVRWDGKNENGSEVSSGIYFYRITTDDFSVTKKMVMLK